MNFLIGIMCLLLIVISLKNDGKIYNPVALFNFWWGITVFVSGFGLYGIEIPNNKTYFIILLSIISFNLGSILTNSKKYKKDIKIKFTDLQDQNFLSEKIRILVYCLQFINMAILINRSLSVINLLLNGTDYANIRYLFYNSNEIMSEYGLLITNLFVTPVNTFSMILFSLLIFSKENKIIININTILSITLFSFSTGSRGTIIYFALAVLISFLINEKEIKFDRKQKNNIFLFFILLVMVLVFISFSRSSSTTNEISDLLQTIVVYFTGSYIYFEKTLNSIFVDNNYLFGGAFFGGILDIFILLFKYIGLNFEQFSSYVGKYTQQYIFIGNNIQFNAFTTMIYSFIYDFGYGGIFIGPFLFGGISSYSYRKMESKRSMKYKGIYIAIVIMIYESILRWAGLFANIWIVIILFILIDFLSNKKNQKRKHKKKFI